MSAPAVGEGRRFASAKRTQVFATSILARLPSPAETHLMETKCLFCTKRRKAGVCSSALSRNWLTASARFRRWRQNAISREKTCVGSFCRTRSDDTQCTDRSCPEKRTAGAGGVITGLTVKEGNFFSDGQSRFQEIEGIANGLGPRFNLTSCSGCHAQPAVGGSSPPSNPQVSGNVAPPAQVATVTSLQLISAAGPVREVRFKSDGAVHDLFTINGLSSAPGGGTISQPDFAANLTNIIFRIPTPTFGAGLIEAIPDSAIMANAEASKPFGIGGHVNRNGNDGTVTRFGWKAQNKSLAIFAGEAYNVEMEFQTSYSQTSGARVEFRTHRYVMPRPAPTITRTMSLRSRSQYRAT